MGFSETPKGKLIPVYLTDDGDIYSVLFESIAQLNRVSALVTLAVCDEVGSRIVLSDTSLNDKVREKVRVGEISIEKKN